MPEDLFKSLTNRLIASDKDAFDQLFRQLYASLVKFSYKYTQDKSDACDIVQNAFVKLWQVRENLERDLSVKSYMFSMVRNLSLNHIRDRSHETVGLETDNLKHDQQHEKTLTMYDQKKERLKLVKSWISELPNRQRQVLEMSRFEGLDHEEIANVLEISQRTVNNHVVAAMKNMKKLHDEYIEMNC
ncbi:MAG: RNA polymerase sigma-70 factor [Bacteroidetes bacterium]|jgi:RNA polymerase sigma-70 factor (ECF subfamily)|nr:RNA polymerase sigma-70 factor [Bacteroidota bacterium]